MRGKQARGAGARARNGRATEIATSFIRLELLNYSPMAISFDSIFPSNVTGLTSYVAFYSKRQCHAFLKPVALTIFYSTF